jgi:hypothetical protein
MKCKRDQVRAAWAAGDQIGALRIAARFFDRSIDTRTFKRGMDAYNNPSFYRQLGKEPEQIEAMRLISWRSDSTCIKFGNPKPRAGAASTPTRTSIPT